MMSRMGKFSIPLVSVAAGVLIGLATIIFTSIFKKDDDEDFEQECVSRQLTVKIKVPKDMVGALIGRAGANIKKIQDESGGARIKFSQEDDDDKDAFRLCKILGNPDTVRRAEALVLEFLSNQPVIITSEMMVPQNCVGRIIGSGGEVIRSLCDTSGARIIVSREDQENNAEKHITIKGTKEQVDAARSLILDKVNEEKVFRQKINQAVNSRTIRREPKTTGVNLKDDRTEPNHIERLSPINNNGRIDVYASAVASPDKFWLQVISPRGIKLDDMEKEMTDYYCKPENRELHVIEEVTVGQIVAAPFSQDSNWYRAEVKRIEKDDENPNEEKVVINYVDYGDTNVWKKSEIFELRTDFLTLHFQAIECFLANVKPKGNKWTEEEIDAFEELAHVSKWRKLTARVVVFRMPSSDSQTESKNSISGVELFDENNVNIGEKLIELNFASRDDAGEPTRSEPAAGNSTVREEDEKKLADTSNSQSKDSAPITAPEASVFSATDKSSNNLNNGSSGSFIQLESSQNAKQSEDFRPRSLGRDKKKDRRKYKKTAENSKTEGSIQALPEAFSDDEDNFGAGYHEYDGFSMA